MLPVMRRSFFFCIRSLTSTAFATRRRYLVQSTTGWLKESGCENTLGMDIKYVERRGVR